MTAAVPVAVFETEIWANGTTRAVVPELLRAMTWLTRWYPVVACPNNGNEQKRSAPRMERNFFILVTYRYPTSRLAAWQVTTRPPYKDQSSVLNAEPGSSGNC